MRRALDVDGPRRLGQQHLDRFGEEPRQLGFDLGADEDGEFGPELSAGLLDLREVVVPGAFEQCLVLLARVRDLELVRLAGPFDLALLLVGPRSGLVLDHPLDRPVRHGQQAPGRLRRGLFGESGQLDVAAVELLPRDFVRDAHDLVAGLLLHGMLRLVGGRVRLHWYRGARGRGPAAGAAV